ncbi:MAG TPA: patatin-like phospholipase family protein [Pyrinomonadaceae bacterium]
MQTGLNLLSSRQVGLALSGGAVRGLAHIGVIKALDEVGIKPAIVAGTSVGSIIGAAIAAGRDWRHIAEMARAVFWPTLLHGPALERFCADHLPETFADLKLPFAAASTIVPMNRAITITSGHLASAISASCALRLLRRPVVRQGLRLKDGGFTCVLPTHACQELGADFVIASDVWEWSSLMRSLGCSLAEPSWRTRAYPLHYRFALSHTNLHIHPDIPATSYVPGTRAVNRMIDVGERATYRALEVFSRKMAA